MKYLLLMRCRVKLYLEYLGSNLDNKVLGFDEEKCTESEAGLGEVNYDGDDIISVTESKIEQV